MGSLFKAIFVFAVNAVFAGFFGLICAFCNLIWLEFAINYYPAIDYSFDYLSTFGTVCAGVYLLFALYRTAESQLDSPFPKVLDLAIILVFILIAMIGFTPVPNSHFIKYLIDKNSLQSNTNQTNK